MPVALYYRTESLHFGRVCNLPRKSNIQVPSVQDSPQNESRTDRVKLKDQY